jgi:hypothetical protein
MVSSNRASKAMRCHAGPGYSGKVGVMNLTTIAKSEGSRRRIDIHKDDPLRFVKKSTERRTHEIRIENKAIQKTSMKFESDPQEPRFRASRPIQMTTPEKG